MNKEIKIKLRILKDSNSKLKQIQFNNQTKNVDDLFITIEFEHYNYELKIIIMNFIQKFNI